MWTSRKNIPRLLVVFFNKKGYIKKDKSKHKKVYCMPTDGIDHSPDRAHARIIIAGHMHLKTWPQLKGIQVFYFQIY